MISVFEGGAYLINGAEIIPDGAEALSQVKAKTGKETTKEASRQQTIASTSLWSLTLRCTTVCDVSAG